MSSAPTISSRNMVLASSPKVGRGGVCTSSSSLMGGCELLRLTFRVFLRTFSLVILKLDTNNVYKRNLENFFVWMRLNNPNNNQGVKFKIICNTL